MTYHKINFSLNTKQQPDSLNLDHFQDKAKKAQQQVQELINTKHSLRHIKEHLFRLIDAMTKNLSLFSYAALEWSKIPLWQKVVTGIVLTVPFFLIGVAAHLAILVTFALVASVVYTASSYLLDNHQDQATQNTEQLKQGVASIASLLDTIICSLELLRAQRG